MASWSRTTSSISIADYFTLREAGKVVYRPTCHYAYHPCDDAVLSLHEMAGAQWKPQQTWHILTEDDIVDGIDELGVLLYGHAKNAYWYGSQLSIEETRRLAPYQNATGLQVTSAVLAGIIWMLENPDRGIVEADEMDFRRCLEIQRPYLGPVIGHYTDWTPLDRPRRAVPGGRRHERPLAVQERAGCRMNNNKNDTHDYGRRIAAARFFGLSSGRRLRAKPAAPAAGSHAIMPLDAYCERPGRRGLRRRHPVALLRRRCLRRRRDSRRRLLGPRLRWAGCAVPVRLGSVLRRRGLAFPAAARAAARHSAEAARWGPSRSPRPSVPGCGRCWPCVACGCALAFLRATTLGAWLRTLLLGRDVGAGCGCALGSCLRAAALGAGCGAAARRDSVPPAAAALGFSCAPRPSVPAAAAAALPRGRLTAAARRSLLLRAAALGAWPGLCACRAGPAAAAPASPARREPALAAACCRLDVGPVCLLLLRGACLLHPAALLAALRLASLLRLVVARPGGSVRLRWRAAGAAACGARRIVAEASLLAGAERLQLLRAIADGRMTFRVSRIVV